MLILMKQDATKEDLIRVREKIQSMGFRAHEIPGAQRTAIGITGNKEKISPELFATMSGVEQAIPVSRPYKLAGRDARKENSEIRVGGQVIGGRELAVIAGPCSVESWEQLITSARAVKEAGAGFLRGGAFKPRTSPYSFQGMKEEGLVLLREAKAETGLKIVTEAKDVFTLPAVAEVADVIQIGARNMSNFSLLEAAGDLRKPILLKRGISSTIEELLMAAEYILARGNLDVILCERGIRTFEPSTRYTLDLNAVPVIKKLSHLPIIVDPSHGIGMWEGVTSMALAAVAAGADGLMIEIHPRPSEALSDGYQSLKPERFADLMGKVRRMAGVLDRTLAEGVRA
ncbi:MAG TPA: 3-deoxy-7-phosphoheptulonate synthase [Bacteroidota bacterium]|nr:3-deoxy-7-phosphoheptulonate synthase [Bacteroidota bacterium]